MNNEFDNNQSGEYTDSSSGYPVNNNPENSNPVNSNPVNSNPISNNSVNNNSVNNNSMSYNTVNTDTESSSNSNNFDYTYSTGNLYSYNSSSQGNNQQSSNPYQEYSAPNVTVKMKHGKKRKLLGVAKLTAAAMVFGLVAGATFQGYYVLTQPKASEDKDTNIVAEVSDTTGESDSIVPTSTSTGSVVTDVSDVVAKAMPSIVAINATANVTSYDFFGREYSEQQQGSGSGIIIGQNDSEILIVTNNHVVEGAETMEIVFADETTATATLKGSDSNADLAVVAVSMDNISEDTAAAIKVARLGNSDEVQPGQMAIAIGNALGYGQSVTVGYISAVNREVTIDNQTMTLLQTDAAINPGNSGGALLNENGEVIGINSVKYASEEVEGMGYSIPISSAIPMINELINRQVVSEAEQGFLGIDASSAQNVTDVYAERFNMPIGVYVNDIVEDSPAADAGLKQGDIITGLDGVEIKTIDDLKSALSYKKAGQKVEMTVQVKENGSYTEKTLNVTLGSKN